MDPNRFAIGAGRQRPPYQPMKLACPTCGASIALKDERAQTMVCEHCHGQIQLSTEQATAIGAVGGAPPGFQLEVGSPFEWEGVRYEVIGRTARREVNEPDEPLTFGYYLYNPTHHSLWASHYQGQWGLSRKTRVLPGGNAFEVQPGGVMTTHDGRQWGATESTVTEVVYVDGSLPWLAQVGDQSQAAEFVAQDGSGETYEAEYSARGELEYGHGRMLTPEQVAQATGGVATGEPEAGAEDDYAASLQPGQKPRLKAIGCITILFGVLCLVTALVLTFMGSNPIERTIPPTGGQIGPITIEDENTVLSVEIKQGFRQDGWSFIEGEVLDADEEYLFGFGDELWAESGYDGGHWHEEKNDSDVKVTIPEPGTYYLAFNASAGAQGSRGVGTPAGPQPSAIGTPIKVTIQPMTGSSLPFLIAGILGLIIGLLLFEAATGAARKVLSEME